MSLTSLTLNTITIDGEDWTEIELAATHGDWLRVMWGLRPGVSSPRCTLGPGHPGCTTDVKWLHAM